MKATNTGAVFRLACREMLSFCPPISGQDSLFFLLLSPLPQKNRRTGVSNGQEHEQPQGAGQSDISETGFGWFGVVCQWYIDFLYLFGTSVSPPLVRL